MDSSRLYILSFLLLLLYSTAKAETPCDSASVSFRQSHVILDPDYSDNRVRLSDLQNKIDSRFSNDSNLIISQVSVTGGASPEGSEAFNEWLSHKRAEKIFEWVNARYEVNDSIVRFNFLGRDWTGLCRLAKIDKDLPERESVISYLEDLNREYEEKGEYPQNALTGLKKLGNGLPYHYMYVNLFPRLRESQVVISYMDKIGKRVLPGVPEGLLSVICIPAGKVDYITNEKSPTICRPFYMGLKTNLLYDALALPNIGVEFYIGKNWSLSADWMYGWWDKNSSHRYWRAYGGNVALRRWFGKKSYEKPLTGHHLGIYAGIITYDFEFGGKGYMGGIPGKTLWDRCNYMAGIEYGYSLPITRRFNIDFSIGIGYLGGKIEDYEPKNEGYYWLSTRKFNWFGPTKAEISLVWLIGCDNFNRGKGGK